MEGLVVLTIAAAVLALTIVARRRRRAREARVREEARAWLARGALVVDARSPFEFARGHIAGAVNLPPRVLVGPLAGALPQGRPLVLYCSNGERSRVLADALRRARYPEVLDAGRREVLEEL